MILQTEKELKATYPAMFEPITKEFYTNQKEIDKNGKCI